MNNISVSKKLFLLLALPLLGMIAYAAMASWQSYQQWRVMAQTEALMNLASSIGNLVHQLQIERGMSAGFLQSKGAKFSQELPGARAESDKKLATLQESYRKVSADSAFTPVRAAVDGALSAVDGLKGTREAISQFKLAPPESAAIYTKAIESLFHVLPEIIEHSDAHMARRVETYHMLLDAKEHAGRERALLTAVFTADMIEPKQYRALIDLISSQNEHEEIFKDMAPENESAFYNNKVSGAAVNDVETMRKAINDKVGFCITRGYSMAKGSDKAAETPQKPLGDKLADMMRKATGEKAAEKAAESYFGVEPGKWFAAATARIDTMKEVEDLIATNIMNESAALAAKERTSLLISVGLSIVGVLLTIGLGIWILNSIMIPVRGLQETILQVQGNNDLTKRVPVSGTDEIAQTGEAFNQLMGSLQGIINNVSESADRVRQSAAHMADSTSQVTTASQAQSEAAAAIASTMEQMTVSIDQVAEHANDAYRNSLENDKLSSKGSDVILQVVNDMRRIADTVNQSSQIIQDLGKQSDEINSIVQVIKEIADQTNLLALNAAIEAARAGEQGRGFAVVADEVRKLAERTSQSTNTIAEIVSKIQEGTKNAVSSMETGVTQVNQGVGLAGQAGEAINQISAGAQKVSHTASDISSAIKEQSVASTDIAKNVEKVAQMSDENHAAIQEVASSAQNLEGLASELEGVVRKFKA